jgi:amidase
VEPVDLAFAGIARQAELIRAGDVSSRELTEVCLERIGRLDPALRAFRVVLDEQALVEADAADSRRAGGDDRSLNGVPIAIKDDTDVAGQVTARGSLAHDGRPGDDAEVVRRLRSAGAVIIGKTQVPELEAMAATESLAFGATHNPWDLTRTPGGSSGGSAAAVAAGLVGAALGTDGAGSIRIPSACCGLFGVKPQRDRVPMPRNWLGMSVTGALTRRVVDNALFLDAAKDPGPSFAAAATEPPRPLRIAYSVKVPRGITASTDDEQRSAVERAAERLRELGHSVEQRDPGYGNSALNVTARFLEGVMTDAAGMAHPERLARPTRGIASMGSKLPGFVRERAHRQEAADRERAWAPLEGFDLLLQPVLTRRPPPIGEWCGLPAPLMVNGMAGFAPFPAFWNHTGQPVAALPVEVAADGFPLSVQIVGRDDDEPLLLALAAQLEAATDWPARRPPFAA